MSLTLHFHPLASYCWKVLVALYENATPFQPHLVDFSDPASAAAFRALWPMAKMPVLQDAAQDRVIPESSIIIEYLARHHPGPTALIPADPDAARRTRLADRFYDLYVHEPMQKIVGDRLRPADGHDPFGVAQARHQLETVYGVIQQEMAGKRWAMGDDFSLADCAAMPALFYANEVQPFGGGHDQVAAYLDRLKSRPSAARVLAEAQPYFGLFPRADIAPA